MSNDSPEFHDLVFRLERLEKQNRWLKRAGVAVVTAVSAVLLMGQAAPSPKVIKAQEFILKDASGHTRAKLSMGDSGNDPGLRILNSSGSGVAALSDTTEGPGLALSNGKTTSMLSILYGRPFLNLVAAGGGSAQLQVYNDNPGLRLDAADHGGSVLLADGASVSGLIVSKGSQTAMTGVSGITGSSGPFVHLSDANGFTMDLGATELTIPATGETRHTSAASIVMYGNSKDHPVIWQAPQP